MVKIKLKFSQNLGESLNKKGFCKVAVNILKYLWNNDSYLIELIFWFLFHVEDVMNIWQGFLAGSNKKSFHSFYLFQETKIDTTGIISSAELRKKGC